jgi:hypothetical protein
MLDNASGNVAIEFRVAVISANILRP